MTAVAIPYGARRARPAGPVHRRPGRHALGRLPRRWYAAGVYKGVRRTVQISPGDLDESVPFLLTYGDDPVLPDAPTSPASSWSTCSAAASSTRRRLRRRRVAPCSLGSVRTARA